MQRANKVLMDRVARSGGVVLNPALIELKPDSELDNPDRVLSRERARQVHRIRRGKTVLVPVRELIYGGLFVAGLTSLLNVILLFIWVSF